MENNQSGALALVGSGEYLPKLQALEQELLRLGISRGKSNTYIQIPTAAGKEGEDRLDFWRQRGADQERLPHPHVGQGREGRADQHLWRHRTL